MPAVRTPARLIAPALVGLALVAGSPAGATPPSPASVAAVASSAAVLAATVAPSAVSRGPSRILLTPGRNTTTTQLISWTMGQKTGGMRLQYRVAGRWSIKSVAATRRPAIATKYSGSKAPRYIVSLTKLKPGTKYSYRIVTRYGTTSWYTFATKKAKAKSVTLLGLGDMQVANRGVPKSTVKRALKAAPGAVAVLQAGDVVNNPTKDKQWADLFSAIGSSGRTRDWVVSVGNHERCLLITCNALWAQGFRNYFAYAKNRFPKQSPMFYYVDYPGVRVVVLDTFSSDAATTQVSFLDRALATNKQPFSIVLMHGPVYSSVAGRSSPVPAKIRQVIAKRNVDLVLSGHDHQYARGYRSPNRTVYVTSVSGPKYYGANDANWRAGKAQRVVWAQGTSTFQVITISGRKLSYKAVVSHRGAGSTSPFGPGAVLDRFVIDKTRRGDKIVR